MVNHTPTPCVLVTGVGAIIGQGIIKSLRMPGRTVRIIGIDRNADAFGARDCDAFYAKPECEDGDGYFEFYRQLVAREGVQLILPGIEHDIFYYDRHREFFRDIGVLPVLNRHELINISRDKWQTACLLDEAGIQTIPGMIPTHWEECVEKLGPPPLLLKPRHGNGSRGIVRLHNRRDFEYWTDQVASNYLIQKIVGSDEQEYTASVFGFGDGKATVPILFRRRLSASGSTLSAEVVEDSRIDAMIERLNRLFKPLGPTNYQFRTESDTVYLLEVNPRISSATSLRAAFDFNEAWMCIDYFMNGVRPVPTPASRGHAVRYVEDLVVRQ